jgi:hypothetical protein
MENLNTMVDDLLNKRTEKINREKELERIKHETFRENLINLFKELEPLHHTYSKLCNIYGNNKEYNVAQGYSNCILIKFFISRGEFALYKREYGVDKICTFTEIKHISYNDLKEWFKYYTFNENFDLNAIVDYFKKDLEHKIELLKKEVE